MILWPNLSILGFIGIRGFMATLFYGFMATKIKPLINGKLSVLEIWACYIIKFNKQWKVTINKS